MYNKVDAKLDFVTNELSILKFWREHNIFSKSVEKNKGHQMFSFYDGPPTANGIPHTGHVLTRAIKDIFPRFKNMQGFDTARIAGWDTHGLPVELEVEKKLGIDGKKEIEKYGVEPFIKKCKESVWKYKSLWEDLSERCGYWVDMEHPYITYENNYIESEWWALKKMFDMGLIYKGHKVVPYCPRCGTSLSSHEVAQGYKDVKEKSAFVKFEVLDEDNTYFLVWTTTPWTLPSNVALCVHPELEYVCIEADGCNYYIAKTLVDKHFDDYTVIKTILGKELEYKKYKPLYNYIEVGSPAFFVTTDEYVTAEDGTGIVHMAPAFGEDDSKVGARYKLPFVQAIDTAGKFKEGCGALTGKFCKDADKEILFDLKSRGLLFKDLMYEHSYPFCWRCDTSLIYYARESWFIKTTAVKDKIVENNQSVNWLPEHVKNGRMGNFLDNLIDWGFSRERYWGTPLPFWLCDKCGKIHAIGSVEELCRLTGAANDIELHKPYVDALTFRCECGGNCTRTPEVMDCWFDSGSMPFAQWHYPFENKEKFERTFPAQFISEGIDQTRGWFYSLQVVNSILFGHTPYEHCITLGMVNDKNGIKMSKHLGNVTDPWEVFNKQGADAIRWYFYIANSPWLNTSFDEKNLVEHQRKMMGTLWNVYSFYILYAEIDKYDPTQHTLQKCKLSVLDKWLISKFYSLVDNVTNYLNKYIITEAAREIVDFVDVLSNWYVRRSRESFWASGETEGKTASFTTLYTVLEGLCKLIAPFLPFLAESIYQNIVKSVDKKAPISVHLCDYPMLDSKYVDTQLEAGMEKVLDIVALGRTARNATNIKNRQILGHLYVYSVQPLQIDEELIDVIKDEINVVHFDIIDDPNKYMSYSLKPNLKTLGPKYHSMLPQIGKYLASINATELVSCVKSGKIYTTNIDGNTVEFGAEDVLISVQNLDGYSASADGKFTVILDTSLTNELLAEGLMREFVSKVQNIRKESGFEVTDRITISVETIDEPLLNMIDKNMEYISKVLLAKEIMVSKNYRENFVLNGSNCDIVIKKAK